jgi:hypothetical protein
MPTNPSQGAKPTRKQLENQIQMLNDALEASLALSPERDNNFFTGGMSGLYEGRNAWDRKKVFAEALRAWRVNPIARRIVKLMTSFIVGKGITIKCEDEATQKFLLEWWNHPLNKIGKNVKRWKDEDTRTGNLFPLFTVEANGMTFVRMVPAEQIEEIKTKDNDIEQEIAYLKDETGTEQYNAYDPAAEQTSFMLHYSSNRPVGSAWGEADLAPLLVWVGRFSSWLEDRVRLNRFRTAFMYVIRGQYKDEAERSARERQIKANPPQPGSVLVLNAAAGEEWGILSANLDAFDASVDGLAIKKMISAGVGFPLHYLAEPESATSTTAEAAGTPTFRTLEETQDEFFEMLIDMARVAVEVRSRTDKTVDASAIITVDGPDITERDNATLALALGRAYPNLSDMFDRDAIEPKEFMRLTYKMFAEVWTGTEPKIKKKPLTAPGQRQQAASPDDESEPTDPKEENSARQWDAKLEQIITKIENKPTDAPTINITNQLPGQEPPTVQVTNEVKTPSVTVQNQIPEQAAPVVNVTNDIPAPVVNVTNEIPEQEAPRITVQNQVETPAVYIENQIEKPEVKVINQAQAVETEPALPKRKRKK